MGAALPWPESAGRLVAWIGRTLLTFLPEAEPGRDDATEAIARALLLPLETGKRRAVLVSKVDGLEPGDSVLGPFLKRAGFEPGVRGYLKRL